MMFSVGLFEELLFRGLLLNVFINKYANTQYRLTLCVLATSVLFGLSHSINLIVRPELWILTICHGIYTVFAGVFFQQCI